MGYKYNQIQNEKQITGMGLKKKPLQIRDLQRYVFFVYPDFYNLFPNTKSNVR